jgi:protein dithiol oxidoreductase (disulfide-forming)
MESTMLKRLFLAAAVFALAFSAYGQGGAPKAGTDYVVLSTPQNTETGNKIEVLEFFWYRCPHCYSLEPMLESWVKKLPADAQFRRLPAVFNEEWAIDARIFYALEALGEVDRLHRPLFDAIHRQGGVTQKGAAYLKWVQSWLAKQNLDMAKFDAALRSFAVESKIKRSFQLAQGYRLDGVPAIAVNGRYLVSASTARDQRSMLQISDYLIAQSRRPATAKK